ncbi:MAG: MarR family transcriptional regulator [Clostridia bacterium]|nr:MarR family transcriptional regulator [Clostridia bacterium]
MVERFERFSFLISEVSRNWHKIAADEMEKYGLKGPHSVYLITLRRYPDGLTAPELCELCGKDKSDVSRMMSIMEKKGLVIKEGVHQNLYRGVFKLTQAGMMAAEHVVNRANIAVELAGKELSDESRDTFYYVLEIISNNLRQINKDGLPNG